MKMAKELCRFLIVISAPIFFLGGNLVAQEQEKLTLIPKSSGSSQTGGQTLSPSPGLTDTLFDIYGPVPVREPVPLMAITITILVAILLLAAGILLKKRRTKSSVAAVAPWDLALTELAEAKVLRNPGSALEYMERTSQILRTYIESRFSIKSTRQTTREFLHTSDLTEKPELQQFRNELQNCLEQADMAKFAHQVPEEKQLIGMEDSVTDFVMKTKPADGNGSNGESSPTPAEISSTRRDQ